MGGKTQGTWCVRVYRIIVVIARTLMLRHAVTISTTYLTVHVHVYTSTSIPLPCVQSSLVLVVLIILCWTHVFTAFY